MTDIRCIAHAVTDSPFAEDGLDVAFTLYLDGAEHTGDATLKFDVDAWSGFGDPSDWLDGETMDVLWETERGNPAGQRFDADTRKRIVDSIERVCSDACRKHRMGQT